MHPAYIAALGDKAWTQKMADQGIAGNSLHCSAVDIGALMRVAGSVGVPLEALDISAEKSVVAACRHGLFVCRCDQYIAWRGNALPVHCDELVAMLRGVPVPRRAVDLS
jgi:hypothetical protein